MNTRKTMRWLLFMSIAAVLAVVPVSVSGTLDSNGVATVDCLDCYLQVFSCCADCSSQSQHHRCTLGQPGCEIDP